MKAFFAHTVSTVNRVNGEVTISWFYVNSGTGQGDIHYTGTTNLQNLSELFGIPYGTEQGH